MLSLASLFALIMAASGLVVQPRIGVPSTLLSQPRIPARSANINMQFGEPGEKLTRENEPDEFFASDWDNLSDAEKLKSPVVIGGLFIIVAPFIAGMIALAAYR